MTKKPRARKHVARLVVHGLDTATPALRDRLAEWLRSVAREIKNPTDMYAPKFTARLMRPRTRS